MPGSVRASFTGISAPESALHAVRFATERRPITTIWFCHGRGVILAGVLGDVWAIVVY
jgi:hypothetical protein